MQTFTGDTLTSSQSAAKAAAKAWRRQQEQQQKTQQHQKGEQEEGEEEDAEEVSPVLAAMNVPAPVFFCSIEPPSMAYQKNLEHALECLQKEDPSLKV